MVIIFITVSTTGKMLGMVSTADQMRGPFFEAVITEPKAGGL